MEPDKTVVITVAMNKAMFIHTGLIFISGFETMKITFSPPFSLKNGMYFSLCNSFLSESNFSSNKLLSIRLT